MKNPGPSFRSQNSSQKKFIQTVKISRIVNDSNSDVGSFTEHSNHDTCEVKSPCSSSSKEEEEEETVQLEPHRGRKIICWAIPKRANTDSELGWREKIEKIQKPAFFSQG
jgi:hypothetical protein